ncbi:MAG: hypothetical protein FWH55_02750 [Oscillospiraceae bacterium]|nr:hypothetical protein [Oscillospiraceae bacterium]
MYIRGHVEPVVARFAKRKPVIVFSGHVEPVVARFAKRKPVIVLTGFGQVSKSAREKRFIDRLQIS